MVAFDFKRLALCFILLVFLLPPNQGRGISETRKLNVSGGKLKINLCVYASCTDPPQRCWCCPMIVKPRKCFLSRDDCGSICHKLTS
ncbi:hypothetical protein MKW94_017396 [Papaver nudicaule]|uniref:Uncharacterized protein n=1 Tax=Papaver nudicaule TaxID=74823 RepID=A0AA41VY66_PAPNU|nr:hypothetical protein [Papaver nudicaule]